MIKARLIKDARDYFKNEWPEQLWTGIMFFNGATITKAEFESTKATYQNCCESETRILNGSCSACGDPSY